MSTRDPFLRSILILFDRAIVFVVLTAVAFGLLWDVASRKALGMSGLRPLGALWRMLTAGASSVEVTIVALCAGLAVTTTAIVSFLLFRLWRRRAMLVSWHVRGPTVHE